MFLLAFQPLYFPDSFARSHSASFGMIIPSAVSTTGVITFIAKVNGFLLYIPIIQQISVKKKHHPPKKYGEGKVEVEIVESYYNMREKIEPCMQLIDYAKAAIEHAGITPIVSPVRGGTDGARLSFKGLPCPNLGTGGHAFHGVFEHITVEGMDKAVLIVKDIIRQFAE